MDPSAPTAHYHPRLNRRLRREVDEAAVALFDLRMGDDALVLSHRLIEWIARDAEPGAAPDAPEDGAEAAAALARIAADLSGQARFLLAAAGRAAARDEDELAFGRRPREFRNALLAELPGGDFAHTVIRLLFFASYHCLLYGGLLGSADPELAAFADKALFEAEYHRECAAAWALRLGGAGEGHARAAAAVEALWPYTAELFAADELTLRLVAQGVAPDPGELHGRWTEAVLALLAEAGLGPLPSSALRPCGGRAGRHTEALVALLADMQAAYAADPDAGW